MLHCPVCKHHLIRNRDELGVIWACVSCGGRAVGMPVLRRVIAGDFVSRIWNRARSGGGRQKCHCPRCKIFMNEIPIRTDHSVLNLDVCIRCHLIWFDPNEYEKIPKRATPLAKPEKSISELREDIEELESQKTEDAAYKEGSLDAAPDEFWKYFFAVMGIPVEHGSDRFHTKPWLTWLIVFITCLVSILSFGNLEVIAGKFGFLPADAFRLKGLTYISAFFLHAGFMHLFGNMYFLWIFGDNVEDYLGKWRYLLLLLLATVAGSILHSLYDPRPEIVCIGASGGISGVITFFALKFPGTRLGFLMIFFPLIKWINIPAILFVIFWIVLQVMGAVGQSSGLSNVSFLAHLGGVAVGIIFAILWRQDQSELTLLKLKLQRKLKQHKESLKTGK